MAKDTRGMMYIVKAFMVALVFVGVLQAISPMFIVPDPMDSEVKELTQKIVPLRASEVPAMLHPHAGKPVMMVLYASWCGYCKTLMPELSHMIKDNKLSAVDPLFLSMDVRFTALSKYLIHNNYTTMIPTPYVVKQSGVDSLLEVMKGTGSSFSGYIPYIGFFNAQGKMVAEFYGVVDKDRLLQAANDMQSH